jgi:uncharacterized protein
MTAEFGGGASPRRGQPSQNAPTPRNALITGSSQGLGMALAEECAARGMNLFLVALPDSGLPQVAQRIATEWEVTADWLEIDLTGDDSANVLLREVHRRGFEVDLLVNNAGIGAIDSFASAPIGDHNAVMDLNMIALTRLTHAFIPDLTHRVGGSILNVSSLGAFFPMVSLPVYSATKGFVLTFSLALREELRGSIRVGTLCPNTILCGEATEEYVDRLPFVCRWACLRPAEVARSGINGLLRDRAIIVPGLINRILRVIGPLIPRSLVTGVIRRLWGGYRAETKDVFAARV